MTALNVKNRTLFTHDNLQVMRGINSETIDLIYLDPPFNSNRNYAAPIGSQAAGAAFKDTWTLTVTGKGKGVIRDGQSAVDWLVKQHLKPPTQKSPSPPRAVPSSDLKSVDEVISHIRASKQCHKFNALMAGDTTGYGSRSEADYALIGVIGFWTQDPGTIDAIFRQSKLYRQKWDDPRGNTTYGFYSINEALSQLSKTHKPKS